MHKENSKKQTNFKSISELLKILQHQTNSGSND